MWRIESRIERLNDLGFDVDELDIVTDFDGDQVRIQPKVVELGHHRRELQSLTGMNVEDAQARRLLNDLAAFTAHFDLGREDRHLVANRWLTQIFEPIMAMVPPDARGKLEPAEIFHEILVHRWYLSEQRRPGGRHLRHGPRLHRHRARTKPNEPIAADDLLPTERDDARGGAPAPDGGCTPCAERHDASLAPAARWRRPAADPRPEQGGLRRLPAGCTPPDPPTTRSPGRHSWGTFDGDASSPR